MRMKITVNTNTSKLEINGQLAANTEELVVLARADAKKFTDGDYKLLVSCRGQFLSVLSLSAADDYSIVGNLDLETSDVDDYVADGRDGDNTVIITLYRVVAGEYIFVGYGMTKMIFSD